MQLQYLQYCMKHEYLIWNETEPVNLLLPFVLILSNAFYSRGWDLFKQSPIPVNVITEIYV